MLISPHKYPQRLNCRRGFFVFMSTIKQKRVAKDILESIGKPKNKNKSVGKAMLDAGYSPAMAKNPHVLTKSNGWKELMEKYLPDEKLAAKLDEGMESMKQIGARKIVQGAKTGHEIRVDSSTEVDDFIEVPDYAVRHKYVETALKVKGKLTNNIDIKSDGEKLEPMQIVIIEDRKE